MPDTLTHHYPPFCPGLSALPRLLRARRCPPPPGGSQRSSGPCPGGSGAERGPETQPGANIVSVETHELSEARRPVSMRQLKSHSFNKTFDRVGSTDRLNQADSHPTGYKGSLAACAFFPSPDVLQTASVTKSSFHLFPLFFFFFFLISELIGHSKLFSFEQERCIRWGKIVSAGKSDALSPRDLQMRRAGAERRCGAGCPVPAGTLAHSSLHSRPHRKGLQI